MLLDCSVTRTRHLWVRRSFPATLPLLVLLLLVLTGCGNSTPPDTVPIVKALLAAAALATVKTKAGAAAKHYIERRTIFLVSKNSGWATESGFTSLTDRIGSEMTQVAAFVGDRLSVLAGTDPVTPAHRDLQDAAKHLVIDGPSGIATRLQTFKAQRADRIAQISWRACAIQSELWAGGDSTLAPTLQKPGLTEILDRRLHSVEILILHDQGNLGKWSVASATAGWKDQQRTSMFQYPNVNYAGDDQDTSDFLPALTAAGLTPTGLAPDWVDSGSLIDYRLLARVRAEAASFWIWNQAGYFMSLTPGAVGATALNALVPITPAATDAKFEDFLDRNLIFCDIMLATLHLQGLRFSRLRRTGADTDFNNATALGVTLRPLISTSGPPNVATLMADGAKWFEAVAIPHDELQVGDHLIYWNNQFVRHILGSAFGLENSYVTRIVNDGATVMLAGHGMTEKTESGFAAEMGTFMKRQFDAMRDGINKKVTASPGTLLIPAKVHGIQFQLVKWAPFGEDFAPLDGRVLLKAKGAWWIRLKLSLLHDQSEPVPSMTDALAMIPKSIRVDPGRMQKPTLPPGDFQSDFQESIYVPMSVPYPRPNGWDGYLASPKGAGDPVFLVDLIPDGSMIPGFFLKGKNQNSKIPVLRPKVQI